ncbi:MAG TPA: M20/M25/M40 family metallo-hydrolase [Pyrinomonadaceae bacterium]|nr:M20/M25/M40 family metallo-hydrolase [Pyrinomonadaceae bacterium]
MTTLSCILSRKSKSCFTILLLATIVGRGISVSAQRLEPIDLDVVNRIKDEELHHSQVMQTVSYLTDVIGPRLTGSSGLSKAQQYAIDRLAGWGIANGHLEPWGRNFGRGWSLEGFTANMLAPSFSSLIAYPKAWSPATNGAVRGEVIFFDVRTEADLAKFKGKLKGKIVLLSPARPVEPGFLKPPQRATQEELRKLGEAPPPPAGPRSFQMDPQQRARAELNYLKWRMLLEEGAALTLEPGFGDGGTVYVTGAAVPTPADTEPEKRRRPWDLNPPQILPQVVVAAEQYNRMIRLIARGVPVQLELNIAARFYDQDPMAYNVIAEIPGSDLKDEVVMIGGCLDSWHAGTGATDNAAGAAVAMEVLRLFKSLNLKPRRTVRIGLWSAEEQGAFGSQAYVANHFGTREAREGQLKSEYEKFSAYFNLDYGTGRIRGVYLQGNEAVRPVFRAWLAPFKEMGADTLTSAGIFATDHNSFDAVGLPGFQFIRDFMENNPRTAHTNMDVYDHVLEDDLKQSAAIAATFIYQASMRDDRLPRKPAPASSALPGLNAARRIDRNHKVSQ